MPWRPWSMVAQPRPETLGARTRRYLYGYPGDPNGSGRRPSATSGACLGCEREVGLRNEAQQRKPPKLLIVGPPSSALRWRAWSRAIAPSPSSARATAVRSMRRAKDFVALCQELDLLGQLEIALEVLTLEARRIAAPITHRRLRGEAWRQSSRMEFR